MERYGTERAKVHSTEYTHVVRAFAKQQRRPFRTPPADKIRV